MATDRTSLEHLDNTLTKALEITILATASVFAVALLCVVGWQVWERKDAWGGVALVSITLAGSVGLAYGWMHLYLRFIAVRIVSKVFWTIVAVAGLGYLLAGMIGALLSHL